MTETLFSDLAPPMALGTLMLCDRRWPDAFEARNLIQFAIQQGIRLIDTAPSCCQ